MTKITPQKIYLLIKYEKHFLLVPSKIIISAFSPVPQQVTVVWFSCSPDRGSPRVALSENATQISTSDRPLGGPRHKFLFGEHFLSAGKDPGKRELVPVIYSSSPVSLRDPEERENGEKGSRESRYVIGMHLGGEVLSFEE